MSILFMKVQWIVAGAALVLVGALVAGTWFRADSAVVADEGKLVRTEKLPNVPGKSITVTVVSYPPVPKISRPDRSKSTRPVKASLSRPEVVIS